MVGTIDLSKGLDAFGDTALTKSLGSSVAEAATQFNGGKPVAHGLSVGLQVSSTEGLRWAGTKASGGNTPSQVAAETSLGGEARSDRRARHPDALDGDPVGGTRRAGGARSARAHVDPPAAGSRCATALEAQAAAAQRHRRVELRGGARGQAVARPPGRSSGAPGPARPASAPSGRGAALDGRRDHRRPRRAGGRAPRPTGWR